MKTKPPAFQFYVKDWRSSSTVRCMSREERGTYIDLLALAWENEGLLPPTIQEIARSLFGYNVRSLAAFFLKFPQTFVKVSAKFGESLVNLKLRQQWEETQHYADTKSLAGKKGNEARWGNSSQTDRPAFASAFASAPKDLKPQNPVAKSAPDSPLRFKGKNGKALVHEHIAEHFEYKKEIEDRRNVEAREHRERVQQQAREILH